MKTLLFLDDRTKRLMSAQAKYPDYEVTLCATVKEFLRLLSKNDYHLLSLDHDLNGDDFQSPDDPSCGMEIVRYIERCGWPPEKPKPQVIIHSSNIFASRLMAERLKSMGFQVECSPYRLSC